MANFQFIVSLNNVDGVIKENVHIDDDELKGLTEKQKDELIQNYWKEWVWEHINGGWMPQPSRQLKRKGREG
jgi:hypothetical protein